MRVRARNCSVRTAYHPGEKLVYIPAFEAAIGVREKGLPALLVCSGSEEQEALRDLVDLVVEGPDGVMAFLRTLTADVARRHG